MNLFWKAAAFAGAMMPLAASADTLAMAGTRLDVVARGSVTRVPDVAVISAGVVTQARDAKSALAQNSALMARVLAALKRAGVADKDVATSNIALAAQYRYSDNQPPVITGYQANNSVTIRFRDVGKSGAILDALVAEGANQISGPNLVIDKPEAALDEARIAAMKTARARAELYARAAGLAVKRIVVISESNDGGEPRPMPMAMMRSAAAPAADTQVAAGEQEIGVTVSVTFELN